MTDPLNERAAVSDSSAASGWERATLERLAFASLAEQKTQRRWRNFFRLAWLLLTLAAAGASTSQSAFWSLPPMFLTGAAAAAGIALVNSLGNIAGMASTALVGWMTDLTGSPNSAMYLFAGFAVIGGLMVLRLPAQVVNR